MTKIIMKEAIVHPGGKVDIIDSPTPSPKASQVLIKVIVSGTNPKDWKVPDGMKKSANSGDDIAGIVEAVGDDVTEFRPGDRVAAFHQMVTPNGSFAEYAIAWAASTFHIPKNISFEEVRQFQKLLTVRISAAYILFRLQRSRWLL